MHWAPRWLEANGYQTLLDPLSSPPTSGSILTVNPQAAAADRLPTSWQLTASGTPSVTGSTLQALGECFTAEFEFLKPALISNYLTVTRTFDVSDIEYVWVVEYDRPIHKLEVLLSDSSWVEISPALGFHDLFQAHEWKWLGNGYSAMIVGLDVFETAVSGRVDSWQFLASDTEDTGSQSSVHFYQHPTSKNWIPIHPTQLRTDGFTGFWSESTSRARFRIPAKAAVLRTLQVRLNNELQTTATLAQPWTSLDERGLWLNTQRIDRESNADFGERLFILSRVQGQTRRALQSTIGTHLSSTDRVTFTTSASTLSLGAEYSGRYQIHNYMQYVYVTETLTPDVDTTTRWKSRYASPELGCLFWNGQKVDHTLVSVSGSLVTVDKTVDNRNDVVVARWRLKLWDATTSAINLTQNFPLGVEELTVVKTQGVTVEPNPSDFVSRRSFKRTSPIYRWSSTPLTPETNTGLAIFS